MLECKYMSGDNCSLDEERRMLLERYTDRQKIEVFVLQGLMSIRNLKLRQVIYDRINLVYPKNRLAMLDYYMAQKKAAYREACEERESVMKISSNKIELFPDAILFYPLSFYSYLSHEKFEEMIIEAEEKERKANKAYRKAKTAVRDCLRKHWFDRIRFANRAIGNENDYSLVTVPTPPTTEPTDEYIENELINVHQWGGALVECLS